jgi:calcineurin-like phosphoesterase family protein
MIFFTADEHYGHKNIIKYCGRPFDSVKEMNKVLISNHNAVVKETDTTIHAGDFCLYRDLVDALNIIQQLSGKHIFIGGSHDAWLTTTRQRVLPFTVGEQIFTHIIDGQVIVVCHYAMRTWPRSHYGSWQLHGHSHGKLEPIGKQLDVGVDNNDYYPVGFDEIKGIMAKRPDNPGLIINSNDISEVSLNLKPFDKTNS